MRQLQNKETCIVPGVMPLFWRADLSREDIITGESKISGFKGQSWPEYVSGGDVIGHAITAANILRLGWV